MLSQKVMNPVRLGIESLLVEGNIYASKSKYIDVALDKLKTNPVPTKQKEKSIILGQSI